MDDYRAVFVNLSEPPAFDMTGGGPRGRWCSTVKGDKFRADYSAGWSGDEAAQDKSPGKIDDRGRFCAERVKSFPFLPAIRAEWFDAIHVQNGPDHRCRRLRTRGDCFGRSARDEHEAGREFSARVLDAARVRLSPAAGHWQSGPATRVWICTRVKGRPAASS